MLRSLIAVLLTLTLAVPAWAWNYSGHRIVAVIAYDRLTPRARARVDLLIRNHPDYSGIFTQGAPKDPAARARYAFVNAAPWPDQIISDARFYDDVRTPFLPGFPDMMRHRTWHYHDVPISGDGTPVGEQPPPNLMTELPRLLAEIATATPQQAAYDLPWIEHLTGDIHQPLHATSRYLQSQPKGDAGSRARNRSTNESQTCRASSQLIAAVHSRMPSSKSMRSSGEIVRWVSAVSTDEGIGAAKASRR